MLILTDAPERMLTLPKQVSTVARERFLYREAENMKYGICLVLPKNGQSSASNSNFNGSRALHIFSSFNLDRRLGAKRPAAGGKEV